MCAEQASLLSCMHCFQGQRCPHGSVVFTNVRLEKCLDQKVTAEHRQYFVSVAG